MGCFVFLEAVTDDLKYPTSSSSSQCHTTYASLLRFWLLARAGFPPVEAVKEPAAAGTAHL
jgi:hypothetical protein